MPGMVPGDKGEPVRLLQLALIREGYPLPRYGADGDFGNETAIALRAFSKDRRLAWSGGEVPDAILDALEMEDDTPDIPEAPASTCLDVRLYDLRASAPDPHPKAKKTSGGKTLRRAPAAIDSIVLHQTAVSFAQPKGTVREIDLANRAHKVACHAMAFRAGFLTAAAPLDWYIYHADRANAWSLGLEVDGNYPGLVGREVGSGTETPLTDATIRAARAGVKWLMEEGRRLGMPIRYIWAHRQFDSWRRADPGQGLWKAVVVEYAVPVLGLEVLYGETLSHPKGSSRRGKPVPAEWDPNGVGRY